MGCDNPIRVGLVCVTMFASVRQLADGHTAEGFDPVFGLMEKSVVMLDIEPDLLSESRRLLMGLGVEVFYGTVANDIGDAPLLLVDRDGLKRSKANGQIDNALTRFPGAQLCVVLDCKGASHSPHDVSSWHYDEALLLLSAAGISFMSDFRS